MPEMIATLAHEYGGRFRAVGERFEVEPAHVRIMTLLGRAKVVEESSDTYRTAHIEASPKKKRNRASIIGPHRKGA